MRNFFGKFSALLGYLLYSGLLLILLLWLLFPTAALKGYIEARASGLVPSGQLRIGEFRLVHPLLLRMRNCELSRSKNSGKTLFHIDAITLTPDIPCALRTLSPCFHYDIKMLKGTVSGKAQIHPQSEKVECNAELKNIRPDSVEALNILLGRQVQGTVSGMVYFEGNLRNPANGELHGNLLVTDGEISLLQPILELEQLAFQSVSASFSGPFRELEVSKGKIDSPLFKGSFEGTINGAVKVSNSSLVISGELIPLEGLFRKGEEDPTVMAVRSLISDGVLPFSLNGTVHNPGILFQRELSEEGLEEYDNSEQGGAEQR